MPISGGNAGRIPSRCSPWQMAQCFSYETAPAASGVVLAAACAAELMELAAACTGNCKARNVRTRKARNPAVKARIERSRNLFILDDTLIRGELLCCLHTIK